MLLRILTDNPGATFTRNIDQKFVDATKTLLKAVKDNSVRQILMETLDDFEHTKMDDENLVLIVSMWKKEKEKAFRDHGVCSKYNIHSQMLTRNFTGAPNSATGKSITVSDVC